MSSAGAFVAPVSFFLISTPISATSSLIIVTCLLSEVLMVGVGAWGGRGVVEEGG